MKKLLSILILACSVATAQITPKYYYQFNSSLAGTIGGNTLTTSGSINYMQGAVGNALYLDTLANMFTGANLVTTGSITVEFLYKPSYYTDYGALAAFFYVGNNLLALNKLDNNSITLTTYPAAGSDNFTIYLDGINRKQYGYWIDTASWHHIVVVMEPTKRTIYVDGQSPPGFSKTVTASNMTNGVFYISTTTNGWKYRGAIDEVAIYDNAMQPKQAYQHYLDFQAGNHYSFTLNANLPNIATVVAPLDSMYYGYGHVLGSGGPTDYIYTPLQQLQKYQVPRYRTNTLLQRNFNWTDPAAAGGLYQSGWVEAVFAASKDIQEQLANYWYYGIVAWNNIGVNKTEFNTRWIALANAYPNVSCDIVSAYTFNSVQNIVDQGFTLQDYITNNSLQPLYPSGQISTYKWLDIYTPVTKCATELPKDGHAIAQRVAYIKTQVSRTINRCSENGEILPVYTEPGLIKTSIVASKNSSGLTWNQFIGRQWTFGYHFYIDSIKSALGGSTQFLMYDTDGGIVDRADWSYSRSIQSTIRGMKYSTSDFYVRWPYNWRIWSAAWHGLDWFVRGRMNELAVNDTLYAPFVSAGWDKNQEVDVNPPQWLGLLKCLSGFGSEFFHAGYFTLGNIGDPNNGQPKGWIWQCAAASYVQAVNSHIDSAFIHSTLLAGDYNWVQPGTPSYQFYAGDKRKFVVVRKANGSNKYFIYASLNPFSNQANQVATSESAQIKIGTDVVKFTVRRQGSVYVWDKTNSIFYQLDGFHEASHPDRWSTKITQEAELMDNRSNPTNLVTEGNTGYDFRTFTTSTSSANGDTSSYQFMPRPIGSYYLHVRARATSGNNSIYIITKTDTFTIGCISSTSYQWYTIERCTAAGRMVFTSSDTGLYRVAASGTTVLIDKFYFTQDADESFNSPITCSTNSATISVTNNNCSNPCTVTLNAGAHTSYLWSTGAVTSTVTKTSVGTQTYTVTVTDNGCQTSTSTTATISASTATATISAGGATTFCNGGSVVLTATSNSTITSYLWSTGAVTSTITVGTVGINTYTVTVQTNNGSATSAGQSVTVYALPTANISPSNPVYTCTTATLTASGGSTFLWSTGATASSITGSPSNTYTVTVTDSHSCSSSATTSVVTCPTPAVCTITPSGATSFCQGSSVTLTATSNGTISAYLWSTGATTAAISPSTAGTYTCTVQTNLGAAENNQVVVVYSLPSTTISPSGNPIYTCDATVTITAGGGITYLWNTGATTAAISGSTATTYTVTATNSSGCTASATKSILACTPSAVAVITPGGATSFCLGGSVSLVGSATGATSISAYAWSTGATTSSILVAPSSSTTYTLTVTTDSGTVSTTQAIVIYSLPTANISPATVTTCNPVTLTATGGVSYLWSDLTTQSTISVEGGTYTVTVTNSSGCTGTATSVVTDCTPSATATITPSGDTTFCYGGSVILAASSNTSINSYLWSTGSVTDTIVVTTSGTYTVILTTDSGSASASQVVVVSSNPTATLTPAYSPLVTSTTIPIMAGGGTTYLWSTGSNSKTVTVAPGVYTVIVTNSSGCSATKSVQVVYPGSCLIPYSVYARATLYNDGNNIKCSMRITWICNAVPDKFELEITNPSGTIRYRTVGGSVQECYLTGLTSGKTYKVRIRSVCSTSVSAWSDYVTFVMGRCQ